MVELRFVDAAEHQAGHFSSESNNFSLPSGESRLSDYSTFGVGSGSPFLSPGFVPLSACFLSTTLTGDGFVNV